MIGGAQWIVATLYRVGPDNRRSAEKGYWNRATAESHYNKMRGKDGVIAMVLYNPDGAIVRSWNVAREN